MRLHHSFNGIVATGGKSAKERMARSCAADTERRVRHHLRCLRRRRYCFGIAAREFRQFTAVPVRSSGSVPGFLAVPAAFSLLTASLELLVTALGYMP